MPRTPTTSTHPSRLRTARFSLPQAPRETAASSYYYYIHFSFPEWGGRREDKEERADGARCLKSVV